MTLLESIAYGFVSGISDFFPVSQQAHQALLLQIFGISQRQSLRDFFVHIAIVLALYVSCAPAISRLRRDMRLSGHPNRRTGKSIDMRSQYELRLLRAATLPMLAGMIVYFVTDKLETSMVWLALFLLLNGVLIIIPEHMRQGNKDARSMSAFDALLLGLSGVLSAFPGISRVGTVLSVCTLRGVDRQHALNWALLLSVPALLLLAVYDLVSVFIIGAGVGSVIDVALCASSAVGAFCGGYLGITIMRNLAVRTGYAGFAFYSWGAALFTFILYLIT